MPNRLPQIKKRPRSKTLTNADKMAAVDALRAVKVSKAAKVAARASNKKPKSLPPPEEMEESVTAKEELERAKRLARERRIPLRAEEIDPRKSAPLTNADKMARAKLTLAMAARRKLKNSGKKAISEALGMKTLKEERAKKEKKVGVMKKQSTFSMIMGQSGEGRDSSGGASVRSGGMLYGEWARRDDWEELGGKMDVLAAKGKSMGEGEVVENIESEGVEKTVGQAVEDESDATMDHESEDEDSEVSAIEESEEESTVGQEVYEDDDGDGDSAIGKRSG